MATQPEPQTASYGELLTTLSCELRRSSDGFALLMCNVWNIVDVQARLGFEASDALMAQLKQDLVNAIGSRGVVQRLGDATFCVMVSSLRNRGHAMLAADKIWRAVALAPSLTALALTPEVHVGVALLPVHSDDPSLLLRHAQLAVASARQRRDRLLIYDDQCAQQLLGQWELESEFAAAIESGDIDMHYQPKIRICDGRPSGAEALMRWPQEGRSVVTPDVFIPLAESAGLIRQTTAYALNTALRQTAEWPKVAEPVGVAVNVAPAMVHDREFVEMIRSAIATWNVKSERLTLEITEGALIADPKHAMATLSRLRDFGVRVSIDDFGTGYSSLSYFRKLSADELKIDKSFILNLLQDEASQRLVRTIVSLAQQFNLAVVAEGVEDAPTLEALAAMGCQYAQGYYFSPALEQPRFIDWLKSQERA